jgi:hypothetical protein
VRSVQKGLGHTLEDHHRMSAARIVGIVVPRQDCYLIQHWCLWVQANDLHLHTHTRHCMLEYLRAEAAERYRHSHHRQECIGDRVEE